MASWGPRGLQVRTTVRHGRRGRGAGGVSQGAVPPRARPHAYEETVKPRCAGRSPREWEGGGAGTQCTCHRRDVLRSRFDEKQESKVLRVRLYGQKKKKVSDENVGQETEGPAAGGLGALRGRGEGRLPPVTDLVASGGPRAAPWASAAPLGVGPEGAAAGPRAAGSGRSSPSILGGGHSRRPLAPTEPRLCPAPGPDAPMTCRFRKEVLPAPGAGQMVTHGGARSKP